MKCPENSELWVNWNAQCRFLKSFGERQGEMESSEQ